MIEVPVTFSRIPPHVAAELWGDLLTTHQLSLQALDALYELRSQIGLIKHFCSLKMFTEDMTMLTAYRRGLTNLRTDEPRRRFVTAKRKLDEIHSEVGIHPPFASEFIKASHGQTIEYERHCGESFHQLVFRIVHTNISELFFVLPHDWQSDTAHAKEWFEFWSELSFDPAISKFQYGIGWQGADRLQANLRREALAVASLLRTGNDGLVTKRELDEVVGDYVKFKRIQNKYHPQRDRMGTSRKSLFKYLTVRALYLDHDPSLAEFLPPTYREFKTVQAVQSGR